MKHELVFQASVITDISLTTIEWEWALATLNIRRGLFCKQVIGITNVIAWPISRASIWFCRMVTIGNITKYLGGKTEANESERGLRSPVSSGDTGGAQISYEIVEEGWSKTTAAASWTVSHQSLLELCSKLSCGDDWLLTAYRFKLFVGLSILSPWENWKSSQNAARIKALLPGWTLWILLTVLPFTTPRSRSVHG